MKLDELRNKSIIILGFGAEGQATYEFLRRLWPAKPLSIADQRAAKEFPETLVRRLESDPALTLSLGPSYLDALVHPKCDTIIKTPGIPASLEAIVNARKHGCGLTSHSQIFLSNYPRTKIIGITGTKGKSTTASLIYQMLQQGGVPAVLVGNIGQPALASAGDPADGRYFVYEFSSHQLAEVESSPHIAVLLNIVPEHLDYYTSFEEYAAAKENITRFQEPQDFLVFNADYPAPNSIARRTQAQLRPFSMKQSFPSGCFLRNDTILWSDAGKEEPIITRAEIPLKGAFNLQNVMAAVSAARLCGVDAESIRTGIRKFEGLPHRLERVGTYKGITFYDDSIATVSDATLAALDALGSDVQTLILGGHERHLDFADLGARIPPDIETVILFPPTGQRIWAAIEANSKNAALPKPFFVTTMEEAVQIAYELTESGRICLLSPASPSFGMFKDYRDRGDSFKACIRRLSNSEGMR